MVEGSAKAGKGDHHFAEDSNLAALKSQVINLLQKASEPALLDCSFRFAKNQPFDSVSLFNPSQSWELGPMFRN